MKIMAPLIEITDNKIIILGERHNLEALGNALIFKAKMGKSLSMVFRDGYNKDIEILTPDDLNIQIVPLDTEDK